ncbi:hypothetical protein EV190_105111 [Actinorugispora endophytica]|uniref:Uncharacterized protein n=1 Tax=Actinorugispora endophytica TaxID=1605990 RepID=A0A4R6UZT5_9ACTN|nr:hypothetical protein EV190_105111 [Actinorugispora endophytica]
MILGFLPVSGPETGRKPKIVTSEGRTIPRTAASQTPCGDARASSPARRNKPRTDPAPTGPQPPPHRSFPGR